MRASHPFSRDLAIPGRAAGNALSYKSSREAILHRTKIDTPVTRPAPIIDASDEPIGRFLMRGLAFLDWVLVP